MEAAKEAGAHELIVNMKDGYDIYIVGWGMKLSGGQKQAVLPPVLRWNIAYSGRRPSYIILSSP